MKIEIATFGEGDMSILCELLHKSMEHNKSSNHELEYICYTLGGKEFRPKGFNTKFCHGFSQDRKLKHSFMIHTALKQFKSDILVITDCDIGVFYHNWDEVIVEELKTVSIFGAEYGCGSLGYKKLPCGFFMALTKEMVDKLKDTDIFYPWFNPEKRKEEMEEYCKHHDVDFKIVAPDRMIRPYRLEIMSQKDSDIFNIPIGGLIGCDLGWKLPVYFKENDIKTNYMPAYVHMAENANLYFLGEHTHNRVITEWKHKDQTFAIHLTKARIVSREPGQTKQWRLSINNYLRNNGLFYRPMQEKDLLFFNTLRNSCLEFIHNKTKFTLAQCKKWFKKTLNEYYIIEDLGKPIGYIRTSNITETSMYIGCDLLPEYRNKGIGYWALNTIMPEFRRQEYFLEVLNTNTIAKKLYDKLGFKPIKEEKGSLLMVKEYK